VDTVVVPVVLLQLGLHSGAVLLALLLKLSCLLFLLLFKPSLLVLSNAEADEHTANDNAHGDEDHESELGFLGLIGIIIVAGVDRRIFFFLLGGVLEHERRVEVETRVGGQVATFGRPNL
jgi:hypothetical protein